MQTITGSVFFTAMRDFTRNVLRTKNIVLKSGKMSKFPMLTSVSEEKPSSGNNFPHNCIRNTLTYCFCGLKAVLSICSCRLNGSVKGGTFSKITM